MKKKEHMNGTDGMDMDGIHDMPEPQYTRGYWLPDDEYYRIPLILPDPYDSEKAGS